MHMTIKSTAITKSTTASLLKFRHVVSAISIAMGLTLHSTTSQAAGFAYVGSDTVESIVEAAENTHARANLGYLLHKNGRGTGKGFQELCNGNATLIGASRPILPKEALACTSSGVSYVEVPIALDAVTIVVPVKNTWLTDLTIEELNTVFNIQSTGKVTSWRQIRPTFPDLAIHTSGVDMKNATFAFFSDAVGLKGFIRSDFKDFKDHLSVARYVSNDAGAIGFLPISEATNFSDQVRKIPLSFNAAGYVMPNAENILNGRYEKLSRSLYFYVNPSLFSKLDSADLSFMKLLFSNTEKFVQFANFVPLRSFQYQENRKRLPALQ